MTNYEAFPVGECYDGSITPFSQKEAETSALFSFTDGKMYAQVYGDTSGCKGDYETVNMLDGCQSGSEEHEGYSSQWFHADTLDFAASLDATSTTTTTRNNNKAKRAMKTH